ncbi:MAG TPA: GNAT family N-acetyltransferase [Caulobacteraceae bacterium]|nr:GNAT family N-acetyltransferase [Caulobacteraceae bacterium]
MSVAPVLETERLVLRGHTLADFPEVWANWRDPVTTRFVGGQPLSEEDSWTKMVRMIGHWHVMGFGYWIVREKGTGRFLGEVGFADFRRTLEPSFEGAPEAGWVIAPWGHGKGIAREAVEAIHAWGKAKWGPVRTVCLIDPDNAPSLKLADRMGYREYARTAYKGAPVVLLERLP